LSEQDLTEIIQGTLLGQLISNTNDVTNMMVLVDKYVSFAQDVQNPVVAEQGYNFLTTKINLDIGSFYAGESKDVKELTNRLNSMVNILEKYAKNHKSVKKIAEKSLSGIQREITFINDSNNLGKCLDVSFNSSYTSEGKSQFNTYKNWLIQSHNRGVSAKKIIDSIHTETIDSSITIPLIDRYFKFIKLNEPGQNNNYEAAIDQRIDSIYEFIVNKAGKDHPVSENMRNMINGQKFYSGGAVWSAAPEPQQMVYDLLKMKKAL